MRACRNLRPADVRKETDMLGHETVLRASFEARRRNAEMQPTGLQVRFCRRVKENHSWADT